jgi:RHS repeat-associated protein
MLPTTNTETHVLISICTAGNAYPRFHDAILSTKYFDDETELAYYGLRYYSPEMGRWVSRDPIGENGGMNLFGFVKNGPVCRFDSLGLRGNEPPDVEWGCCGEDVYDLNRQCCYEDDGAAKVGEKHFVTGIKRCFAAAFPTHSYLKKATATVGCGFYLKCHLYGTCSTPFPMSGPGVVDCNDIGGTCWDVSINECEIAPDCFEQCVAGFLVNTDLAGTWNAVTYNCHTWVITVISGCKTSCAR